MIIVTANGGTKTQRKATEDAVYYFINKLLPRKKNLIVDVNICNTLIDGAVGFCEMVDKKEYIIQLHNRGNLFDYLYFLAHEMVHVKQYAKGELNSKGEWKGEDMRHVGYLSQPWEKEAFKLEIPLAKDYIKNKLKMTYNKAKTLSPRTLKEINIASENRAIIHTQRILDKREIKSIP